MLSYSKTKQNKTKKTQNKQKEKISLIHKTFLNRFYDIAFGI